MYHPGDLIIVGEREVEERKNILSMLPRIDAREVDGYDNPQHLQQPFVYLPHSCDGWIIGGLEAADALIADLMRARDLLRD